MGTKASERSASRLNTDSRRASNNDSPIRAVSRHGSSSFAGEGRNNYDGRGESRKRGRNDEPSRRRRADDGEEMGGARGGSRGDESMKRRAR